jgi:sugar phosphate isomerase/epimerase
MQIAPHLHLTYCTNIHPSNGWDGVLANLREYAPPLKAKLSPEQPFGIGLRLSALESRELLEGNRLAKFRAFLAEQGLYVFTLNGFPYGPFHKQAVKDQVHAPDWREVERVEYTRRLIEILASLLPEGMAGGISTSPLSYKPWLGEKVDEATWELLTRHIVQIAAALVRVRESQGKVIHLDIEPEPDGLIENSRELVAFYEDWLLPVGGSLLAEELGIAAETAQSQLLEHIRVCWDTCHMAVGYEEPREVLARFMAHGIKVGKIQVSSAVKVFLPDSAAKRAALRKALHPFAESTYLHQVIQKNKDGSQRQFPDLDEALPEIQDPRASQWRIHFHVPIFLEEFGHFGSTQDGILETFALLRTEPFTTHLEIETYTWDVLPADLKKPLRESIQREFEWVLAALERGVNN